MKAKEILVVDDEPGICSLLTTLLTRQGYNVRSTVNAEKVGELCEAHPPDLVITDLCMPDLDGFDLIQQLRSSYPAVRIMAISGKLIPERLLKVASKIGAHLTCAKPFQLEVFLESVRRLLSGEVCSVP